ncbi:MAG TPA: cyclase family protein [Opitutaceae bacterium]|nr:cyclase family protein [Opitutaceae bacterium]
MKIYDITVPLSAAVVEWPGDTAYNFSLTARIRDGASCNVGRMVSSMHFGTHADAPFHYGETGLTMDAVPPEIYVGPARVLAVPGRDLITIENLHEVDPTAVTRVLLKTGSRLDHTIFPKKIPVLAPDVPAFLGACGVKLLGLDLPSVDQVDSKDLPIHHALEKADIYILENLDLSAVPPGDYELIALPLKIVGGDGSPVRAILRTLK